MTKIFLETGKNTTSEYVFVHTVAKRLGLNVSLECVNGKDNLKNIVNQLKDNTISGGKNLIVFDADSPQNGGGFNVRQSEIQSFLQKEGIDAQVFLFPDNSSDGDFETLLLQLARKDINQQFFDCFSDYEKCLGSAYFAPDLKAKVYTYVSSQKSLTKAQRDNIGKGEWQFLNPNIWDLDSDALRPLIDFLKLNVQTLL